MEEILIKYFETKSNKELAEMLNVSETTIVRNLKKLGLSRRIPFILEEGEYLKDIPNFSRYQVSNYGRFIKKEDQTVILQSFTPDGYLVIKMINDEGKRKTSRSNRIVALVFVYNDCPKEKIEANHKDGVKTNNYATNLEWATPSENQKHAYDNGLRKPVHSEQVSHYSKEQVEFVCKLLEDGLTTKEIMSKFNWVKSKSFVDKLKRRETWTELSKNYTF